MWRCMCVACALHVVTLRLRLKTFPRGRPFHHHHVDDPMCFHRLGFVLLRPPRRLLYLQGKLEFEMELLTADEAEGKENGYGRKDPNQFPKLKPPNRPPTSFFWLTNPWKVFRYIIWKNYKVRPQGGNVSVFVSVSLFDCSALWAGYFDWLTTTCCQRLFSFAVVLYPGVAHLRPHHVHLPPLLYVTR